MSEPLNDQLNKLRKEGKITIDLTAQHKEERLERILDLFFGPLMAAATRAGK